MSENTNEQRPQTLQDLQIPAPDGKRSRAYDADYVDQILEQAQDALDARTEKLHEAHDYIRDVEQQLVEAREALATKPVAPVQEDSHQDIASRSSELLARAAQIADEHVREAKQNAADLVAEAQARIQNATRDADQARRALEAEIARLGQAKSNAIRDLEGLLGSHLSALHNYVRQTGGEATRPETVPAERKETPVRQEVPVERKETAEEAPARAVDADEQEDPFNEL